MSVRMQAAPGPYGRRWATTGLEATQGLPYERRWVNNVRGATTVREATQGLPYERRWVTNVRGTTLCPDN
jgi:hypothetical protein